MGVAVVTGAGSGIGAQAARALALRGDQVAVGDLNAESAATVAREINDAGGRAIGVEVDVSDETSMGDFMATVLADLGAPSTVVGAAGIGRPGAILELPVAHFDQMMAVNARGMYLLARATLPHLVTMGGTFTAIASDAGVAGAPGWPAYCASKHAVVGMIKSLALEFGPAGVRVNAVCPGYVQTPMLDRLLDDVQMSVSDLEQTVPTGRVASVEDVAEYVLFLSSDRARQVNGAVVLLDGGASAGPYAPS